MLEAAITCLAELGYPASTVAVVAERAGVSRGAAQHHFPTRDALFTAALEHVTQVRAEELRRELDDLAGGRRPSTAAVVDLTFSLYTGTLFRAALALWVAAASEPALREQIVPLEARIGREIHRVVVGLLGVDEREPACARPCRRPSTSRAGWGWRTCSPTTRGGAPGSRRSGPASLDASLPCSPRDRRCGSASAGCGRARGDAVADGGEDA